jgi:ABC-type branched-subunit amino acid transport system ATPase component
LAIREYEHSLAADLPLGVSRLVELGRALCTDPKLLLLDEPSSGLRIDESRRLAETLRRLKADAGMSILVVEHDMSFVLGLCERVTVLDFGRVLAEGPPDEIRADPVVQAAYLGDELEAPAKKAAAKKRAPATKKAPAKKKASAKKVTRARAPRG